MVADLIFEYQKCCCLAHQVYKNAPKTGQNLPKFEEKKNRIKTNPSKMKAVNDKFLGNLSNNSNNNQRFSGISDCCFSPPNLLPNPPAYT